MSTDEEMTIDERYKYLRMMQSVFDKLKVYHPVGF